MSSHRSYSWTKSDSKLTSYSPGSTSSSAKSASNTETSKKYESSYSRTKAEAPATKERSAALSSTLDKLGSNLRYSSSTAGSASGGGGTSGSGTSYRSLGSSYSRDKSGTRDKDSVSSTNRYASVPEEKPEKQSILNKYLNARSGDKASTDSASPTSTYSRLAVPSSTAKARSRETSPVAERSRYATYGRSATAISPRLLDEAKSKSQTISASSTSSREKPAESGDQQDKSSRSTTASYGSSYSSYKLYSRPLTYSRPLLKDDTKLDLSSRYGTSRYSGYVKSTPTPATTTAKEVEKEAPKVVEESKPPEKKKEEEDEAVAASSSSGEDSEDDGATVNVTVVTRGTSPTAPCSSAYLRTRRADMAKTIEKTVSRPRKRPKTVDKEMQSDRLDDTSRSSRYGSLSRVSMSPWSTYTTPTSTGVSSRYTGGGLTRAEQRYYSNYSCGSGRTSTSRTSESESEKPSDASPIKASEPASKPIESGRLSSGIPRHSPVEISQKVVVEVDKSDSVDRITVSQTSDSKPVDSVKISSSSSSSIPRQSPIDTAPPKVSSPTKSESVEPNRTSPRRTFVKEKSKSTSPTSPLTGKSSSPEISGVTNQLPPQVPKTEAQSLSKSSTASSVTKTGKKIVKKIVKKKTIKKSSSVESENSANEPESPVSENAGPANKPLTKVKSKSSLIKSKSLSKSDSSSTTTSDKCKSKTSSRSSSGTESNPTASSSSDDDEDDNKDKPTAVNGGLKPNRSATSCMISSADDASLSYDNSTKPPQTPRSAPSKASASDGQPRTEEAKSFLMRALAPVASLFKMQYQQNSGEERVDGGGGGEESNDTSNNAPSLATDSDPRYKITVRRIESGQSRDWWLDSTSASGDKSGGSSKPDEPSSKGSGNNGFKLRVIESGERPWWLQSSANVPEGVEVLPPSRKGSTDSSDRSEKFDVYKIGPSSASKSGASMPSSNGGARDHHNGDDNFVLNVVRIRHVESGEKAWWLASNKSIPDGVHHSTTSESSSSSSEDESDDGALKRKQQKQQQQQEEVVATGSYGMPVVLDDENEPLGDRKSPEGLEAPARHDEGAMRRRYDGLFPFRRSLRSTAASHRSASRRDYISRHVDIDDVLGTSGQLFSPMMERLLARRSDHRLGAYSDYDDEECEEIDATQVRIHDSTAQHPVIQKMGARGDIMSCMNDSEKLEIGGDEEGIVGGGVAQQQPGGGEPQLSLQEMTCRVRYVNDTDPFRCWSEVTVPGKAALHTFSTLLPLTCQLPALHRLLGAPQKLDDSALQVYKDGDYGPYLDLESSLSEQQEELEGFLDNRKNSIVLRTQLSVRVNGIIEKLLNSEGRELRRALFSLKQIFQEDKDLVHEFVQNDGLDCLIRVGAGADQNYQNYILRALGQVMLYVDGMNGVMKHPSSLQWLYTLIASDYRLVVKTTLKLLLVFVEYIDSNSVLLIEAINAVDSSQNLPPWTNIINLLKDFEASDTELLIYAMTLINKCLSGITDQETYYQQTDSLKEQGIFDIIKRYISFETIDLDLKRQLQIYEASMNHQIIDQRDKRQMEENMRKQSEDGDQQISTRPTKSHSLHLVNGNNNYVTSSRYNDISTNSEDTKSTTSPMRSSSDVFRENIAASLQRRRERMQRQRELMKEQQALALLTSKKNCLNLEDNDMLSEENMIENHMLFLKKQGTVKDIAGKLSTTNVGKVAAEDNIISKAIKGLSNCQIKESRSTADVKAAEAKRSHEIEWLNIAKALNRPLVFNSYDFSDLTEEDEDDEPPSGAEDGAVPPPPPPFSMPLPPPPSMGMHMNASVPPPPACPSTPAPPPPDAAAAAAAAAQQAKTKKTIKLFWREIPQGHRAVGKVGSIWDELGKVKVDEAALEVLFETRTKEVIKKQLEANKNREVIVLDHKRSNAINILLKKLPPTQSIKNAIVNMDSSVLTREGIDKLLAMLPTKEEILKIQEAQVINPSTPLGKAEQFLLTLSSIYELNARLKLWAFKQDFECFQNEILEAYIDMKQAIEVLKVNVTFKKILACILSIGVFLNGSEAKGFQIEYLSKIQEVKDTVNKHSLLHHLCHMVLDQFPDTSDLYSEIGAVTRSSKINYEELSANIDRLETECKNHMGNFKIILKHDSTAIKTKVGDFLHDCAERIIIIGIIKRRLFYRYSKFLLWLGVPAHHVSDTRPSDVFKIISEFALEYRTTRQQLQQQRQRKASHRERSKTRGKMITELNQLHINESAENELTSILNTENFGKYMTNPLGRKRKDPGFIRIGKIEGSATQEDGIEEVFNILLEKSRNRKKERPSKNSQKLQNRSKNPVHHQAIALFSHITGHLQKPDL